MFGVERALFYLNFIAELALLCRLIQCKLYRIYKSLFLYWLAQATGGLILLFAGRGTWLYLYIYWAAQTVNIFMALYVVQDLFHIALAEHPAIASFGRRIVLVAIALAALVALAGVTLDATIQRGQYAAIQRFSTFERSMNFVILIFLLLISILLLWFPIKVRRNLVVYISGFLLFAAARSFGLLLANLLPQGFTVLVSTILLALTLVCLLTWTMGIRPEGERVSATPGYRRDPEAMQRLERQLDAINAALGRFVRN
jgi:membrane-associated HD superfamily phosphohydrolase